MCVLTTTEQADTLEFGALPVVLLDAPETAAHLAELSTLPMTDAQRRAPLRPDAAAYLIYTSGSTGTPKGVLVAHRNVVRAARPTRRAVHASTAADVWTMFHSPAFDFSVWELWGALLPGGTGGGGPTAVTARPGAFWSCSPREGHRAQPDPDRVLPALPTLRHRRRVPAAALRYVVFGGEALDPARPAGLVTRHGDTAPVLVNMYGITETWCTSRCAADTRTVGTAAASRSGGRCRTCGSACWMRGCGRCRWGWRGSCMWRGRVWRGGIWGGRG